MSNKKHIDRVFREKFKDFEVTPNAAVWENIKSDLDKGKKDRKGILIWWRYGGVAALLLLLVAIGGLIYEGENTPSSFEVVDGEQVNDFEKSGFDPNQSNTIVEEEIKSPDFDASNTDPNSNNSPTSLTARNKEAIIANSKDQRDIGIGNSKTKNGNESLIDNSSDLRGIAENSSREQNVDKNDLLENKTEPFTKNSLANRDKNNSDNFTSESNKTNMVDSKEENYVQEPNNDLKIDKNEIVDGIKDGRGKLANNENETNGGLLTDDLTPKDSLSIEQALAKIEDVINDEDDKITNRWGVSPNIGPVYYNTMGKGSHIDDQFVGNPKSGEINTSYGINVSYAISKKLRIRSGIHSLNLSYNTNDVIIFESLGTNNNLARNQLGNVRLSNSAQGLSALSADNLVVQQTGGVLGDLFNTSINQRIGYYEVPLELQYDLLNRSFGINLIGGFSTFLLNNNEVSSRFQQNRTFIGEANNINDLSFSANFGVGLNYNFSERFKFNFEPTFKYQINAFNKTSGNFQPYIIGVYTGFSFKF